MLSALPFFRAALKVFIGLVKQIGDHPFKPLAFFEGGGGQKLAEFAE